MSILTWNRLSVRSGLRVLTVLTAFAVLGMTASAGAPQGRGAGGAQGRGGAGRGAAQSSLDDVLVGTIDVHTHQGPDNRARSLDAIDVARLDKMMGMRGLVLKSHLDPTADRAYFVRKEVPGIEAFGLIDLNLNVGGLNPDAIEHFVQVVGPTQPDG